MPKTAPQPDAGQDWWMRAHRRAADAPTTLREQDAPPGDATILNISSSGCLIQSSRELPLGSAISLAVPGLGPVPARVIRRDGDRFGCAFARALPAGALIGAETAGAVVQLRPSGEEHRPNDVDRWPPAARLLFALGTATTLWAIILTLI